MLMDECKDLKSVLISFNVIYMWEGGEGKLSIEKMETKGKGSMCSD